MTKEAYKYAQIEIQGMTCKSCEISLERALKKVPGILDAKANHARNTVDITAQKNNIPCDESIAQAIHKIGYSMANEEMPTRSSVVLNKRIWMEIGASLLIITAIYIVMKQLNIISVAPSLSENISMGGALLLGLIAGTSSCLAVTGGLLLAMATTYSTRYTTQTSWQKFQPLLQFNIGRIISYFILGGMIGAIGTSLQISPQITGILNITVSIVMLYMGLCILRIIPRSALLPHLPKSFTHAITKLSESRHPTAPILLGAGTFFLPCGFTQSLQLAALASGSVVHGALIMGMFALGTLPSLLGISVISSCNHGKNMQIFMRFAGTLIIVLAVLNAKSGFNLIGLQLNLPNKNEHSNQAIIQNGIQEIHMKVESIDYNPNNITIQAGIPVRWIIDATHASGCTSIITIPTLNISQRLVGANNIIEFTAPDKGTLPFTCGMGMANGTFNVI